MITWTRRDLFRSATAAGFAYALPQTFTRSALARTPPPTFTLANGLRVHCAVTSSPYIGAALTLRSKEIMGPGGLGHILEHTSFTGAAGTLTAAQVKERHKTVLHDSNATTGPGIIQWQASFLPRHIREALHLFALTSLDQKFDVDTVASEAKVVLQELYLDKYDGERAIKRRIDGSLYGSQHPFAIDTTEEEIAKAKTPPAKLAEELREYAKTIQLPANMDLFLVGKMNIAQVEQLTAEAFAPYPFGEGPLLDIPNVGVTRAKQAFKGTSQNLKQPLSELRISWNTGVRVFDPEATVLVALSHYMDDLITLELREKKGDVYTPEVSYEPDRYSGVFKIKAVSSKDPAIVESRVLSTIEKLKTSIDERDLERFIDKLELGRMKAGEGNDSILKVMVERVVEGGSVEDCDISGVTPQQIQDAARKYLPAYNGAYVRAVLAGR